MTNLASFPSFNCRHYVSFVLDHAIILHFSRHRSNWSPSFASTSQSYTAHYYAGFILYNEAISGSHCRNADNTECCGKEELPRLSYFSYYSGRVCRDRRPLRYNSIKMARFRAHFWTWYVSNTRLLTTEPQSWVHLSPLKRCTDERTHSHLHN